MRRTRCTLIAAVIALAAGAAARAAEIDLATAATDLAVWGRADDHLGLELKLADLDGDGRKDLLLAYRRIPVAANRFCAFFSPLTLPAAIDLATDTPPLCFLDDGSQGRIPHPYYVATGDLDGDGLNEVVIGSATSGIGATRPTSGSVRVYRGRTAWPSTLTAAQADWIWHGIDAGDNMIAPAIGDLNGDGHLDLAFGASSASGPGNARTQAGEVHIVLGPASRWTQPVVDLAVTPPDSTVYGADASDRLSFESLTVADVTGDDVADLVAGSDSADGPANDRTNAGEVHVVAGRAVWPAAIDFATEPSDLVVYGPQASVFLGHTAAADWDGDGATDLLIGATRADAPARTSAGAVFFLRGPLAVPGVRDLATAAADGFVIGPRTSSRLGSTLLVGDVNGDGSADLVAAGENDPTPHARNTAGAVQVVLGCGGSFPARDLLAEPAEIEVLGARGGSTFGDRLGSALALGDLDGDGVEDVVASATHAQPFGRADAGAVHVVLGSRAWLPAAAPVPGDLGNTLRAARSVAAVALSWAPDPAAATYAVYRSTDRTAWPPSPARTGLKRPADVLPDVSATPALVLYRAVGLNCAGVEGQ